MAREAGAHLFPLIDHVEVVLSACEDARSSTPAPPVAACRALDSNAKKWVPRSYQIAHVLCRRQGELRRSRSMVAPSRRAADRGGYLGQLRWAEAEAFEGVRGSPAG